MSRNESTPIPTESPEMQDGLPLHDDIQEQFDVVAKRLHSDERDVFEAAAERYDVAYMQVGEKAIGQMGHQIRESEKTSALMSGAAYQAFNTMTERRGNKLWTARDEVVDELMAGLESTDNSVESVTFAASEVAKAADAFMEDRIARLKEESTQVLDGKVDALLPHSPDAHDTEAVADIGKRDFDERIQSKLDTLEAVAAGILPKHIGQRLVRKLAGGPLPESPATDSEIFTAIRDFEVTVDAVRNRDGVNSAVRDSIREYLTVNGLIYPAKADYQRVVHETLAETDHLYEHDTTKEELMRHLKETAVKTLRDLGYIRPEAEKPKEPDAPKAPEAYKPPENDDVLKDEVLNRIEQLQAAGIPDKKIKTMLLVEYRGSGDDARARHVSGYFVPRNSSTHFQA